MLTDVGTIHGRFIILQAKGFTNISFNLAWQPCKVGVTLFIL